MKTLNIIKDNGTETTLYFSKDIVSETEKAVCFNMMRSDDPNTKKVWVPKSVIKISETQIIMASWFYSKYFGTY
jgi:hypothetical protein